MTAAHNATREKLEMLKNPMVDPYRSTIALRFRFPRDFLMIYKNREDV